MWCAAWHDAGALILPGVDGIHLGKPSAQVLSILRDQFKSVQQSPPTRFPGANPALMEFSIGLNVLGFPLETAVVEATPPLEKSVVWRIWEDSGSTPLGGRIPGMWRWGRDAPAPVLPRPLSLAVLCMVGSPPASGAEPPPSSPLSGLSDKSLGSAL